MRETTIYDVAKEAGVSIASVSNVINGKGKVSAKKREEIRAVMERLNYRPNVLASALMGKKTYTLGLLVPDVANPFFAEIARLVEDHAHQAGYSVIACSTDNKDERIERYIRLLKRKRVDGLMIGTGLGGSGALSQLKEKSVPLVMIARGSDLLPASSVLTDDRSGGAGAARHLLGLGHRRLAVLAENAKVTSSKDRVRGFREALAEAGLKLAEADILVCETSVADGERAAGELLRRPDRPTALFCCNDMLAAGALRAAKRLGIRVPGGLSVVGFDNTILAEVTDPALTTIAQPLDRIVGKALELLIGEPEAGGPERRRFVMEPELIVRESTAPPPDAIG
ncbi:LacI family DNA-binding transcriptional regulator [Cohnella zeiphila]|uniref:LacI family DNA-binding transcriptional regulator n=1 Tax=Cohnella zeiphila TaxID=2761120 RepID=A0A7X0VYK9_9BACL|nr:LacI family DNA-binding transcriptional regulator [Cohnella zeiphila]MBB6734830.1 LacI family DNA-binding transcriptional regulator [Cohnella zeiphila]